MIESFERRPAVQEPHDTLRTARHRNRSITQSLNRSIPCYFAVLAPIELATASPMSAGLLATRIPAAYMALIFSAAVPFPPEIIAPA